MSQTTVDMFYNNLVVNCMITQNRNNLPSLKHGYLTFLPTTPFWNNLHQVPH